MHPLNHLLNYSSEAARAQPFLIARPIATVLSAVSVPFELAAVCQNAIKLPFQTAACIVKIPAKIINIGLRSPTLAEFDAFLAGPKEVLITALKIIGYALGALFTATIGILSPFTNFQLHHSFGLVDNFEEDRETLRAEEKENEIAVFEKIVDQRLLLFFEALRREMELLPTLNPEQRKEIESLTGVPVPPLDDLTEETNKQPDALPDAGPIAPTTEPEAAAIEIQATENQDVAVEAPNDLVNSN